MNEASLTGPEKAALVLSALPEEAARAIVSRLDEHELRRLVDSVERVQRLSPTAVEHAISEFETLVHAPVLLSAAPDAMRRLVTSAVGRDRARKLLSAEPPDADDRFAALRSAPPATLANLLEQEHPQIAAVVLSQLSKEQAAAIIRLLPEELQGDLVVRLAGLGEVPVEVVSLASDAVSSALVSMGATQPVRSFDGVTFMAGLLNELAAEDAQQMLAQLDAGAGTEVGNKVRDAMFTFEDLIRLTPRSLQPLMRDVPSEVMLTALKTATRALQDHFLSAVSTRAAEQMREDLSLLPPMRISDIDRAQREVVEHAKRLADAGRLALPGFGGEKLV